MQYTITLCEKIAGPQCRGIAFFPALSVQRSDSPPFFVSKPRKANFWPCRRGRKSRRPAAHAPQEQSCLCITPKISMIFRKHSGGVVIGGIACTLWLIARVAHTSQVDAACIPPLASDSVDEPDHPSPAEGQPAGLRGSVSRQHLQVAWVLTSAVQDEAHSCTSANDEDDHDRDNDGCRVGAAAVITSCLALRRWWLLGVRGTTGSALARFGCLGGFRCG